METQGPLAVIWTGIGLICFYIALIWINSLLGVFLTPLFIFPATWLMKRRAANATEPPAGTPPTATDAQVGAGLPRDDRSGKPFSR